MKRRIALYGTLWLILAVFDARPLFGQDSTSAAVSKFAKFDEAVQDMADEIQQFVASRREAGNAVRVSSFEGPNGTSSGANVVRMLCTRLTSEGVNVGDTAGYKVSGKVSSMPDNGMMVTQIQAEIANSFNTTELTLRKRIVTDASTAIAFLGTTADLSRAATAGLTGPGPKPTTEIALTNKEATVQLISSVQHSKAEIVQQGIGKENVVHEFLQVSQQSPYGLAVLKAGPQGSYLPCEIFLQPTANGGQLGFISLGQEDLFKLVVRNASGRPVGCDLRLDGINVFAFSQYEPWRRLGKMVIAPGGGLVAGWHKAGDESLAFRITAYGESAAGQLGVTEGTGTITAIFYELHDSPLQGDPIQDAIGFGDSVRVPYKPVPKAFFGNPVGTVTIRYRRPEPPRDLPPLE